MMKLKTKRLILREEIIKKSEEQIKEGKFVKTDTKMSDEEIDNLLMD